VALYSLNITVLYKILKLYIGSSLTNNSKVCTIDMMVSVVRGNIITSNTVVSAYKVSLKETSLLV